ncbi:MAG: hypothetical protein ABR985_12065 [Methanotrichaceae archaeon]|jgi:hypothetical protein
MRKCQICKHNDLEEIDRCLLAGGSVAGLAREFEVSEDALRRHTLGHLTPLAAGVVDIEDSAVPVNPAVEEGLPVVDPDDHADDQVFVEISVPFDQYVFKQRLTVSGDQANIWAAEGKCRIKPCNKCYRLGNVPVKEMLPCSFCETAEAAELLEIKQIREAIAAIQGELTTQGLVESTHLSELAVVQVMMSLGYESRYLRNTSIEVWRMPIEETAPDTAAEEVEVTFLRNYEHHGSQERQTA